MFDSDEERHSVNGEVVATRERRLASTDSEDYETQVRQSEETQRTHYFCLSQLQSMARELPG